MKIKLCIATKRQKQSNKMTWSTMDWPNFAPVPVEGDRIQLYKVVYRVSERIFVMKMPEAVQGQFIYEDIILHLEECHRIS